jgi:hypothetical protein
MGKGEEREPIRHSFLGGGQENGWKRALFSGYLDRQAHHLRPSALLQLIRVGFVPQSAGSVRAISGEEEIRNTNLQ